MEKNTEDMHYMGLCTAVDCEYSCSNSTGEMGWERTEIKMQLETCHNGLGQMVVVNTAFGECLDNHEQNSLHIMSKEYYVL